MTHGEVYKLRVPIGSNEIRCPLAIDDTGILQNSLGYRPIYHLKRRDILPKNTRYDVVYNPVYDSFVPIRKGTSAIMKTEIIDKINDTLVPETLPPIKYNGHVAGVVLDGAVRRVLGIVDVNNTIKRLKKEVDFDVYGICIRDIPSLDVGFYESLKTCIKDADAVSDNVLSDVECDRTMIHIQRYIPCNEYNLSWDKHYEKCKMRIKRNIVVVDSKNLLLGYL
jgi:hypothetical protein